MKGYLVLRCPHCGLGTVDPTPDRAALAEYYSRDYALAADVARVDASAYRAQAVQISRLFAKFAPGARTVCEVGCAGGWLLKALQARGYEVCGYELSETTSRFAREELGLDVVTGELEQTGRPFDIILMRHSLEHTIDPRHQVEALAARLAGGGTVFIAVPNGGSLASRLLGQHWSWYIPPVHIWYFTARSLVQLLRRVGLEPIHRETRQGDAASPPVELCLGLARLMRVRRRASSAETAARPRPERLRNSGLRYITERLLDAAFAPVSALTSALGLGDELWVIATKTGNDGPAAPLS